MVGELQWVEESFDTLPAGFAGGLDADLDQNILRGTVLSTVVGGHRQLIHVLFAIAQFLRVLDEAWVKQRGKGSARAVLCLISKLQLCKEIHKGMMKQQNKVLKY